jgi:hypothetical protein
MDGKASLASQVYRALLAIFHPDESRHLAKEHRGMFPAPLCRSSNR